MTTLEKKPRERLLEAGSRLFYQKGIRSVGVDMIIAEAGVAKMSFYNHFPSKDALVVEFIEERSQAWQDWYLKGIEEKGPRDPLVVFDLLYEKFLAIDFRGCAFINTMVEVADFHNPAHQAARKHKQRVIEILRQHLENCGIQGDLDDLAYDFLLLLDGATVAAVRDGNPEPALKAKKTAAMLLSFKS